MPFSPGPRSGLARRIFVRFGWSKAGIYPPDDPDNYPDLPIDTGGGGGGGDLPPVFDDSSDDAAPIGPDPNVVWETYDPGPDRRNPRPRRYSERYQRAFGRFRYRRNRRYNYGRCVQQFEFDDRIYQELFEIDARRHQMAVTMVGAQQPPEGNLGRSGPGYPPNGGYAEEEP